MRLRPSGKSGPLAISLESFTRYQLNDAWTWEHMALTRARVIHGPPELASRLEAAVREVLTRPRDPDKVLRDVAEMRLRIEKEFGTTDIWEVKYIRGGTIDVEFIAQYLMLRHASEHPEILSSDAAAALRAAARAGLLDAGVAEDLCGALSLWRRIQGFLRLTTEGRFIADKAPAGLRASHDPRRLPGECRGPVIRLRSAGSQGAEHRGKGAPAFRDAGGGAGGALRPAYARSVIRCFK